MASLFQGRYKALLVDAESYLLKLVRYIHNYPVRVRAKIVMSPEKYPWSNYTSSHQQKQGEMDVGTQGSCTIPRTRN